MICEVESFVKPRRAKNLDSVWIETRADQVSAKAGAVDREAEELIDPRTGKFSDEIVLEDHHPPTVVGCFQQAVPDNRSQVFAQAGFRQGDHADSIDLVDENGLFRKCFRRLGLGH